MKITDVTNNAKSFGLLLFLIGVFAVEPTFSQVKIADNVKKQISWLNVETIFEMGAAELDDGHIQVFFHDENEKDLVFGRILLTNQSDFDALYEIIIDGFETHTKSPIKVDLGESFLYLYYVDMLWGSPFLNMVHGYKSAPYQTKTSQRLNLKDIKKLFGKMQ